MLDAKEVLKVFISWFLDKERFLTKFSQNNHVLHKARKILMIVADFFCQAMNRFHKNPPVLCYSTFHLAADANKYTAEFKE